MVVPIPVISPLFSITVKLSPVEVEISSDIFGSSTGLLIKTWGAAVLVYPKPGLVKLIAVTIPAAFINAVAVAVVPIPTVLVIPVCGSMNVFLIATGGLNNFTVG